jgi:hypothetical protein
VIDEPTSRRLTDVAVTLTLGIARFNESLRRATGDLRRFSAVLWAYRLRSQGDALRRPDGRPRRTGHRHRGTDAWERRWGVR